jgi:hypothetical protein
VRTSALVSLVIDSIAVPLAHRHDKHHHLLIPHLVDQPEASSAKLDLVAVG